MNRYRRFETVTKRGNRTNGLWYPLRDYHRMPVRALFPVALRIERALVAGCGLAAVRESIAQGRLANVRPGEWLAHIERTMGVDARRTAQRELAAWVRDAGDVRHERSESEELTQRTAMVWLFDARAALLGLLAVVRGLYSKRERDDARVESAVELCEGAFRAYGSASAKALAGRARRVAAKHSDAWAGSLFEYSNVGETRCRTLDMLRLVARADFAAGALTHRDFHKLAERMRIGIDWVGHRNSSAFHELVARELLAHSMTDGA